MDQISETTPLLFSDFEFPHENLRSETFLRTDRFAKKKVAVGKKEIATFRERVAYFVDNSSIRLWWQFADAILNAIFVGLYVWCTEYEQIEKHKPKVHPPDALLQADIVFAFLIFVQWVPRVYFSVNVQREFFSFHTVVSVLATWSVLIVALWRFLQDDDYCDSYMCAGKLIYIYPFRFLRLHLSLVRVLKPSRGFLDLSIPFNRVVRKAAQVIVTIVNTLATVAAWVHLTLYIQQGFKDLSFFDVFYSLTVSSVSGLQTDIIADNPVSRIVILYVMIVGAIFIPSNLAELFDLMKFQSKYDKAFRPVQAERQSHVLVVGNVSYPLLVDFLKEFFCDDHGVETMNTQVVILSPVQPDEDTQILLQDPLYMSRVQYVKGSPRNFNHLQRARADIAKACFILATKSGVKDPAEDDAYSVMIALVC
ncbi:hypothetical protein HK098_002708 [Nowakowskiella sp. JEL0407]|nr:hypothetical protein HK098_002708 [Nowakowskiella sp. JEL0407]